MMDKQRNTSICFVWGLLIRLGHRNGHFKEWPLAIRVVTAWLSMRQSTVEAPPALGGVLWSPFISCPNERRTGGTVTLEVGWTLIARCVSLGGHDSAYKAVALGRGSGQWEVAKNGLLRLWLWGESSLDAKKSLWSSGLTTTSKGIKGDWGKATRKHLKGDDRSCSLLTNLRRPLARFARVHERTICGCFCCFGTKIDPISNSISMWWMKLMWELFNLNSNFIN